MSLAGTVISDRKILLHLKRITEPRAALLTCAEPEPLARLGFSAGSLRLQSLRRIRIDTLQMLIIALR